MFDYVVAGGCSLAHGVELKDRSDRFTNLVARHYNSKITDYSGSGYSNEAIAMNVINGIAGQLARNEINPEKTLVLINWTYINRLVYYNSDVKGWFSMFPHRTNEAVARKRAADKRMSKFDDYMHPAEVKTYYNNHSDSLHLLYNFSSLVHKTQTFLNLHKIKYVFSPSCQDTIDLMKIGTEDFDMLYNKAYSKEGFNSFKNILDDIEYKKFLDVAFIEYSKKNKFAFGSGNHPLEDAHKGYSTVLLDFIGELYD
jgi:hypothetical protein